jgi:hypothetical protein
MDTLKLTSRLAGSLALAGVLSTVAFGQSCPTGLPITQTDTDTFGPELADWPTDTLMVGKFVPPAGATLIRAELSLCGQLTGTATFTNNDTTQCTFTFEIAATVAAVADDATSPIPALLFPDISAMGGPITLSGGQSGNGSYDSGVQCISGNPLVFTSPADLAWFVSQPGDTEILINHSGLTTSTTNGCGALTFDTEPFTNLFLRVDYTYCVEQTQTTPTGGCVCSGPSPHYRRPGSLLLFPEFDNQAGAVSLVTVTNVDCTRQSNDVTIEYIYIDETNCQEFNRTETLTPCDTLTLLTNIHNPNQERGYLYVFAKDEDDNSIVFNQLIGSQLIISGLDVFDYSVNPVAFRGVGSATGMVQPDGTINDLDGDDIRDLDGTEYEAAPNTITIPRFLGQDAPPNGLVRSQLVLIALSGGSQFTETRIDCLLYNDNEEAFSFDHTFYCWDKPFLLDVAPAASNIFLKTTETDPNEIIGATQREAGWLCCDGAVATSTQETIEDPAFYMVLVERVGNFAAADLPFECGVQTNGALVPRDILGDGDPTPVNGDNQ